MNVQEQWFAGQFDRCWPWIESAIRKMREPYGRDYVWSRIQDGTAQIWPGQECVIVTEIDTQQDGSKVVNGWIAAGNRHEIEHITTTIEAWAKRIGCVRSRLVQRPGFMKRPMPGYRLRAVVMEKEL